MGGRGSSSRSDGGGRMMNVSSIASRIVALPGGGKDSVRVNRVRAGLLAGKNLGPVHLTRLPNGKLYVEDGRHRLLVAHELNIPIRVKISRGVARGDVGTVHLFPR